VVTCNFHSQSCEKFESVMVSVRRVWRHRHSGNNKEAVLFLTRLITTTWAQLFFSIQQPACCSDDVCSWRQGKSQLRLNYIWRRTSQIGRSYVDMGIARSTYRDQLQPEYTLIPTMTHYTSDTNKVWTAVLYLRRFGAVARVRSQVNPCRVYSGQVTKEQYFLPSHSSFSLVSYRSINALY